MHLLMSVCPFFVFDKVRGMFLRGLVCWSTVQINRVGASAAFYHLNATLPNPGKTSPSGSTVNTEHVGRTSTN